jgi:hypothetical protein
LILEHFPEFIFVYHLSVFGFMNIQSIALRISVAMFSIGFIACRHDPLTPLEDAPTISFKDSVQPIIISNCTQDGCHGSNGREFELITYNDIAGRVSAGKPHSSKLYKVITANALGTMPPSPNPRLTDTDIKTIYLWIMQGANDN